MEKLNIQDQIDQLRERIRVLEERSQPFKKPTADEVYNHLLLKGVDTFKGQRIAEDFCNYFESVGWVVGKKKMKDWKKAIIKWIPKKNDTITSVQRALQGF